MRVTYNKAEEIAGARACRALQVMGRGLDLVIETKAVGGFKAGRAT